ncbi:hypothetical protein AGLY_006689 [Aphis glycines]|uniref:Uncharacterized protein n=1 Tax=Aphis glycines TaxID=307491 RepID=A0A6G0TS98_APHGL|nr:hypothetical protein AGLY_006689 [Aphis glycines]
MYSGYRYYDKKLQYRTTTQFTKYPNSIFPKPSLNIINRSDSSACNNRILFNVIPIIKCVESPELERNLGLSITIILSDHHITFRNIYSTARCSSSINHHAHRFALFFNDLHNLRIRVIFSIYVFVSSFNRNRIECSFICINVTNPVISLLINLKSLLIVNLISFSVSVNKSDKLACNNRILSSVIPVMECVNPPRVAINPAMEVMSIVFGGHNYTHTDVMAI